MKKHLLMLTPVLLVLHLASAAQAQEACIDAFSPEAQTHLALVRANSSQEGAQVPASLDPHYMQTMATWRSSWENNVRDRLIGGDAPALPTDLAFSIEDFHRSREFRSWFETSNRMARELSEKPSMVEGQTKLLPNPQEALATKITAIRQAKYTIDMTYYIVRGDESGLAVMGELKNAISRGVSVRMMYDGLGSLNLAADNPLRALLEYAKTNAGYTIGIDGKPTTQKATVELVEFHAMSSAGTAGIRSMVRAAHNSAAKVFGWPLYEDLAYSPNRRSHDKILLIDGAFEEKAVAFIGGRNLADEYYNGEYTDLEVMLKGVPRKEIGSGVSIGAQMQEYFDELYFHIGNREITRSLLGMVTGYKKTLAKMDAAQTAVSAKLDLDRDQQELTNLLLNEGVSEDKIEIVNTFQNIFRTKASRELELVGQELNIKNSRDLMQAVEHRIAAEKEEVVIVSPYLWMSEKQIHLMKAWLLQDPARKLTIVTNSIMTSDNMLAQILVDSVMGPELMMDKGLYNDKGQLIRRSVADQVKIYEYGHIDATDLGGKEPYGKLHQKSVYLKGSKVSIVGTYNNDPRSLLLNSEGAAIVESPQVAAHMEQVIAKLISRSHLWGSAEYQAIRANAKLPESKREVASHLKELYDLLIRLKIWWVV